MTHGFVARFPLIVFAFLSVACGYDNGDRTPATAVDPASGTIDTGATMSGTESGVGVFVEYATGGIWKLQVGCDTDTSDLDCQWDILAYTPEGGHFFSSQSLGLEGSDLLTVYSDGQLELKTTTKTDLDGVLFTAEPGQPVTFDLWLNGVQDPEEFFYYVTNGAVKSGAKSPVIELTPSVE